jgi:hypothetical protein
MLTWAALIAVAAIAWGVFRATVLQPIRPPTGERHGPIMLAEGAAPDCTMMGAPDGERRRVVVDFDCVRATWPDASIFVSDLGITVMLDSTTVLCGPGVSRRCAVR